MFSDEDDESFDSNLLGEDYDEDSAISDEMMEEEIEPGGGSREKKKGRTRK